MLEKDAVRWCKQAIYPSISIQHVLIVDGSVVAVNRQARSVVS